MKEAMRKGLRLMLLAVFAVSTVILLYKTLDKQTGSESYEAALEIALQKPAEKEEAPQAAQPTLPPSPDPIWVPEPVEDDPELEELAKIDLEALRAVNPEVMGWIRIPGTKVDYPLLQGGDNEYYLKYTWEKKKSGVGSVFLECRNDPDMTDYNTIIYAHNMKDGSMFAALRKYTDRGYWEKHPYVYLLTDAGSWRYEIFSTYKAPIDSPTYGLSFEQFETKAKFMAHAVDSSRYDTEIIPEPADRILTLSTCTGSGYENRWVVQARLKMIEVQP